MNQNQKLAIFILLILVVVMVGSGYFIYQSQKDEDDYYSSRESPVVEQVIADTSYGPVDFVTPVQNSDDDTSLVIVAEEMPEFPGGQDGMMHFLDENLEYPMMAKEQGIQGKVWINFVVDRTGRVTNVELEKGIGGGCDEEAIRVIKKMPNWKPGRQSGKPVNVKFRFPINFTLR